MGSARTFTRRAQRQRRKRRELERELGIKGITTADIDRAIREIVAPAADTLFANPELLTYLRSKEPRCFTGPRVGRVPFDWEKDPTNGD